MGLRRIRTVFVGIALIVFAPAACGGAGDSDEAKDASPSSSPSEPVTREVIASAPAPNAPGQTLSLLRITIQPGAEVPAHRHNGVMWTYIDRGEITFKVEAGVARVARNGASEPTQEIAAPGTTTLREGDTVYETGDMVNSGRNGGETAVVVIMAALGPDGEPLTTPT